MRKLSFLFILPIFFITPLNAQKDSAFAIVRYTFTHTDDTTQPDRPAKRNMALYLGKSMSLYANYDKMQRIANGGTTNTFESVNGGRVIVSGGMLGGPPPAPLPAILAAAGNYYKDIEASNTFSVEAVGTKVFSVEDKMPVIDWVIAQETKDIMGMVCQKATGDFKGRTYTAWFNSQLPFNNGPWKLGGLPGLILEAYDAKNEVMFKLVSYQNATGKQTAIEIPKEALKTTPKEMKQYREALQKDRDAAVGANGVTGGMVRVSTSLIGPDGKPIPPKQVNNPIEKEIKKQVN